MGESTRRLAQLLPLLAAAALAAAPAPAAAQSAYCRSLAHKRFVRVSNSRELEAAVRAAKGGDLIEMQDGTYAPLKVNGKRGAGPKQEQSITLCGSRKAMIVGNAALTDHLVYVQACSYVRLVGFTVAQGLKGVVFDGTVSSLIAGMVGARRGGVGGEVGGGVGWTGAAASERVQLVGGAKRPLRPSSNTHTPSLPACLPGHHQNGAERGAHQAGQLGERGLLQLE